jgi:hypothetical protein
MAIPVNTYNKHTWVDNSSPDLEAEILNEIETGIKDNNDAIKAIAAAVVSQIVNDPDKIASMAALYAVNQTLGTLSTTVTNINSNLALKANASDLTNLAQKTLINGYAGDAGTNSYDLIALSAYLVICSTVGNNNTSNIAAYIVVAGGGISNTGTIFTLVSNNNFSVTLTNGIKLAITSSTYHTAAIKQL